MMRASECNDVLDLAPGPRLSSHESVETVLCVLVHMAANFRNIRMRGHHRVFFGEPFDDVKQREGAVGLAGEIIGATNSGKSWLAGLLCERLILHGYSVCVIDPEGDYGTLGALPGVTVLGGEDPTAFFTSTAPRVALPGSKRGHRSVMPGT